MKPRAPDRAPAPKHRIPKHKPRLTNPRPGTRKRHRDHQAKKKQATVPHVSPTLLQLSDAPTSNNQAIRGLTRPRPPSSVVLPPPVLPHRSPTQRMSLRPPIHHSEHTAPIELIAPIEAVEPITPFRPAIPTPTVSPTSISPAADPSTPTQQRSNSPSHAPVEHPDTWDLTEMTSSDSSASTELDDRPDNRQQHEGTITVQIIRFLIKENKRTLR